MLQKLKNRSTATTWLMMIGFAISLTTMLEGIGVLDSVLRENQAANNYAYSSQFHVTVSGSNTNKWDMEHLLYGVNGLITLEGAEMYFDEADHMGTCSWTTLIKDTETLKYPLKWGRLPQADSAAKEVAVPDFMEKYTKAESDVTTILIQGSAYRVVGVFDTSEYSDAYAYVIGYKALPEEIAKEIFSSDNLNFTLRSDHISAYAQIQKIKDNILEYSYNALVSSQEITTGMPILQTIENSGMSLFLALYLFSIVNCIVASNYWIVTKRRDMAVRKAFGWSNKNLTMLAVKEMGGILAVSILLSVTALKLLAELNPAYFSIRITLTFLLYTFGLLLLTLAISVTVPLIRILKIKPAEGVA